MKPFPTEPCPACGVPIVVVEVRKKDGRLVRVHLDPRPDCYIAYGGASATRNARAMVSHSTVCAAAKPSA